MTKPDTSLRSDPTRPHKIKNARVVLLLILTPIIAPCYLLGMLVALVHVSAFCGYKNSEKYFMSGLGYENDEEIISRLMKEHLK